MGENPLPVCSPSLQGDRQSLSAQALAELPLLQQTTRPYAWRQWFNAQDMNVPRDMTGPRYELFSKRTQFCVPGSLGSKPCCWAVCVGWR